MRAGALELAAELAPLARANPEQFAEAWSKGIEQITAEALDDALVAIARGSFEAGGVERLI